MKVVNLFVNVFVVFAFLTLGSLMIIVSLQVLTMEDALLKVQELYENPWHSLKMGVTGILFLSVGLIFSKRLIKELQSDDEVVLYGKWGPVSISLSAIDDLARKVIRKFEIVRLLRIRSEADGSRLKVVAHLAARPGWNLQELIHTIQKELGDKIQKVMGGDMEMEVSIHIVNLLEEPVLAGEKP